MPRNARDSATVLSRGRARENDLLGRATAVPRYFFHFSDGERQFSDDKGQDLAGLRAARAHATGQVRELKVAMCDQVIQDLSGWSMSVADARGRIVFVLGFDLKPRPIAPPAPMTPRRSPSGGLPDAPPAGRPAHVHADAANAGSGRAGVTTKD